MILNYTPELGFNRMLIYGTTGSGKSCFIQEIILKNIDKLDVIFILTSTNDLKDYKKLRDPKNPQNRKVKIIDFNSRTIYAVLKFVKEKEGIKPLIILDDMLTPETSKKEIDGQIANMLYNGRHYSHIICSTQNLIFFDPWRRSCFNIAVLKYTKSSDNVKRFHKCFIDDDYRKEFVETIRKQWKINKYISVIVDENDNIKKIALKL